MAKPLTPEALAFLRGMHAALAIVAAHDEETIYREIVRSAGARQLVAACENDEDFEWSGLKRYGYRRRRAALRNDT